MFDDAPCEYSTAYYVLGRFKLILQFKVVLVPSGQTVSLVMSDVSAPVTVQICIDFQHSVQQDVRENTVRFTFRSDIAYDLIHFDNRQGYRFFEPVQHLFLAEKVVIQFLVQVFRIFASANKVVFLGEFENVNVRHPVPFLSCIRR